MEYPQHPPCDEKNEGSAPDQTSDDKHGAPGNEISEFGIGGYALEHEIITPDNQRNQKALLETINRACDELAICQEHDNAEKRNGSIMKENICNLVYAYCCKQEADY